MEDLYCWYCWACYQKGFQTILHFLFHDRIPRRKTEHTSMAGAVVLRDYSNRSYLISLENCPQPSVEESRESRTPASHRGHAFLDRRGTVLLRQPSTIQCTATLGDTIWTRLLWPVLLVAPSLWDICPNHKKNWCTLLLTLEPQLPVYKAVEETFIDLTTIQF